MTLLQRNWLSLAALGAAALAFGLLLGLRAVPLSETDIIEAAARDYASETGGTHTDCFARPVTIEPVRLVVICDDGSADVPWVRSYDEWGREGAADVAAPLSEPST